jgi:hypothetical protein
MLEGCIASLIQYRPWQRMGINLDSLVTAEGRIIRVTQDIAPISYHRKTSDKLGFLLLPGRQNSVHQGIAERLVVLVELFAHP